MLEPKGPAQVKHYRVGASQLEVGRYTYGHEKITVKQFGEGAALKVGAFCSIASGVNIILGGNHRLDWATTFPFGHVFKRKIDVERVPGHPATNGDIIIGNDVWIGQNATIMSGVHIADGAVVAANATVVKDIGPYEVWGGNPAKKIKTRFDDTIVSGLLHLKWWEWSEDKIAEVVPLLSTPPTLEILDEIRAIADR